MSQRRFGRVASLIVLLAPLLFWSLTYMWTRIVYSPTAPSAGVPEKSSPDRAKWDASSVLLVTFDALSLTHMSAYGYERLTTPNIDRLARNGAVFTRAIAASSWTYPSLASLFTSTNPRTNGVYSFYSRIRDDAPLPCLFLKKMGIKTCFFVAHSLSAQEYDRGFMEGDYMPDINAAEVTDRAISWLKTNGHERFFLWIHYFEPHAPYRPPGDVELPPPSGRKPLLPIAACPRIRDLPKDIEYKGYMAHGRRDIDFFIDLYDRLIRYADREFGRLLDFISSRSWSPSCTVLVSSDHGEAFGQHNGIMEHGAIVYEEQIRVPLIVHTGQDFQRRNIIREPVSMIDLMPTVCEIMTGRIPENLEGRSLVPLLKGGRPRHRPLISEIVEPWHKDGVSWSAVMAGRHKILYGTFQNPEFLYYDLSEDPCELNPKEITPWVEITSPTLFHLKRLLVRYMKRPYPPGTEPLSPEVEEMLRAMGYLQ